MDVDSGVSAGCPVMGNMSRLNMSELASRTHKAISMQIRHTDRSHDLMSVILGGWRVYDCTCPSILYGLAGLNIAVRAVCAQDFTGELNRYATARATVRDVEAVQVNAVDCCCQELWRSLVWSMIVEAIQNPGIQACKQGIPISAHLWSPP